MSDYRTDVHLLLPNRGHNVHCLNGSAHLYRTTYKCGTTCPKCIRISNGESTAVEEAQRHATL